MPVEIPTLKFEDTKEALATAAYVEQMLIAEQQWIMNRLQWLFVSQSFLIAAFVNLATRPPASDVDQGLLTSLKFGIPVLGAVFCLAVRGAVWAAERVGQALGDERAKLTQYINERTNTCIPMIGTSPKLRIIPFSGQELMKQWREKQAAKNPAGK